MEHKKAIFDIFVDVQCLSLIADELDRLWILFGGKLPKLVIAWMPSHDNSKDE
jgi:hypothetical protein